MDYNGLQWIINGYKWIIMEYSGSQWTIMDCNSLINGNNWTTCSSRIMDVISAKIAWCCWQASRNPLRSSSWGTIQESKSSQVYLSKAWVQGNSCSSTFGVMAHAHTFRWSQIMWHSYSTKTCPEWFPTSRWSDWSEIGGTFASKSQSGQTTPEARNLCPSCEAQLSIAWWAS